MLSQCGPFIRTRQYVGIINLENFPMSTTANLVKEISKSSIVGTMSKKKDILKYFSCPPLGSMNMDNYVRPYILLTCSQVSDDLSAIFEKDIPTKVDWNRKKMLKAQSWLLAYMLLICS